MQTYAFPEAMAMYLNQGLNSHSVKNASPVATGVTAPDNAYLNALVWGGKWSGDVTYSLYVPAESDLSDTAHMEQLKWNDAEASAVRTAFNLWASVSGITFKEISDDTSTSTTHADLRLVKVWGAEMKTITGYDNVLGYFKGPSTPTSTNFWQDTGIGAFNYEGAGWNSNGLAQGGYGFITLIHEIGHAIGLAHPHDDGGQSGYFPGVEPTEANGGEEDDKRLGDYELNQGVWTTMSYNDGLRTDRTSSYFFGLIDYVSDISEYNFGMQGTPMAFDIAAIQHIYGKADNNTGATTYSLPDSNISGTFYSCIWDYNSSGDAEADADTISYSGSRACTIDLRAAPLTGEHAGGYISKVEGVYGGYTIANGVVIENATGGTGNDVLIGNAADNVLTGNAGDDTLIAGAGANTLDGGAGNDLYKFDGAGIDEIVDVSGRDTLVAGGAIAANIDLRAGKTSTINGATVTLSGAGTTALLPVDVYLLQDLSGSFGDDVRTVRSLVPSLVEGMREVQPDIQFGFGSFVDYPVAPFGSSGDYVYQNHLSLTTDSAALQSAIDAAEVKSGYDAPEAQLAALLTLARQYTSLGFRSDSYHSVVLLTDASYHEKGDEGGAYSDASSVSYPSVNQLRDALASARITPIFAATSSSRSYYDDLVVQLGTGSVVTLNSDSSNIVSAISDGLEASAVDAIENAVGSSEGDILTGNALNNELWGGAGNDLISALQGNDYINGGDGDDTVIFSGAAADYKLVQKWGMTYVSEQGDGVDQTNRLVEVEQLRFSDQTVSVGSGLGSYLRSLFRDFNGDGKADVLFKNDDGRVAIWSMDGTNRLEGTTVAKLSDTQWELPGIGDFDGDGTEDMVFQHADGRIATWTMDGTTRSAGTIVGQLANPKWSVVSTGDFNGDNKSDLLFEGTDGEIAIWTMDGTERFRTDIVAKNADTEWKVAGTADFNYDGISDILFRHSDGRVAIWQMNGQERAWGGVVETLSDTNWTIAGTGDLNGDHKADIVLQHTDGRVALWTMDGTTRTGGQVIDTMKDTQWEISDIADYNGDGRDDILFSRPDGQVAMWTMDGASRLQGAQIGTLSDTRWSIASNGAFGATGTLISSI